MVQMFSYDPYINLLHLERSLGVFAINFGLICINLGVYFNQDQIPRRRMFMQKPCSHGSTAYVSKLLKAVLPLFSGDLICDNPFESMSCADTGWETFLSPHTRPWKPCISWRRGAARVTSLISCEDRGRLSFCNNLDLCIMPSTTLQSHRAWVLHLL